MAGEFDAKVLEVERFAEEGKNTYLLIRMEKPQGFEFKAGQFVLAGHPKLKNNDSPGELLYRAYSIAAAPHMPFLEFVIAIEPTGGLSKFLSEHLAPGDTLHLKGPFGEFLHRSQKEKAVFIVTGAGIAPAMSMVRDLMFKGSKKVIQFFYGFHSCDMFLFKEELKKYSTERDNFFLFPTSFKDGPCCWNGTCGYVQPLVEEAGYNDENTHFYVCGSPGSMKASFEVLTKMKVPMQKIFTEVQA
ncbi:MAG: FAD-binding oxidoreductase [Candidatus Diapherotrites archaeon]|nr:FAD-binding oxidoreductase [Candidatus Diapherotrites archaeon]